MGRDLLQMDIRKQLGVKEMFCILIVAVVTQVCVHICQISKGLKRVYFIICKLYLNKVGHFFKGILRTFKERAPPWKCLFKQISPYQRGFSWPPHK